MEPKDLRRHLRRPSWMLSEVRDVFLDACDAWAHTPFAQAYRAVRPYTMCGNARLRGLFRAVQHVVVREIPGDLVECGAARGGSAALMGLALKRLGGRKTLWVFDTFEGIPPPGEGNPDRDVGQEYAGRFRGELHDVQALFRRLGILEESRLIKGLFQETLPASPVGPIAVLHLDCDWYESVTCCLEQCYDRVSRGGIVQIDDYGHWAGARKAVEEFFRRRSLHPPLRRLDYSGRQFLKP